jgi:hypothetical protein
MDDRPVSQAAASLLDEFRGNDWFLGQYLPENRARVLEMLSDAQFYRPPGLARARSISAARWEARATCLRGVGLTLLRRTPGRFPSAIACSRAWVSNISRQA